MTRSRILGKSTPRLESVSLATGKGKFLGDMYLEGMLHAKILRSPHAHARIRGVDISRALSLEGVKCIITALDKDLPDRSFPNWAPELWANDQRVLSSTVRYVGEPVAAIAAEREDIAEQARDLIEVEYERLPAVFNVEEAVSPGAVRVHENVENNIAKTVHVSIGDIESGFRKADHVFEDHFETSPNLAVEPEPYGIVAFFDEGKCNVWCPTQAPFFHQSQFAGALGITPKVISPECAGGGFGRKSDMYDGDHLVVLLAERTRRPVRIVYDRRELLGALDTNVPIVLDLKSGVRNGRFTARYLKAFARAGAYLANAHSMLVYGICHWASLYRCPNVRVEGRSVYTNNSPAGSLRGFGVPMFTFALESQVDRIAHELGMDPIKFRLRNIVRKGDITPTGFKIRSCELEKCLRRVAQLTGWKQRTRPTNANRDSRRGLGLAIAMQPTGSILGEGDMSHTEARILKDGLIHISNSTGDTGSGTRTVLAMIAAEELGVSIEEIAMSSIDTDQPYDSGTFASRTATISGQCTRLACVDLKKKILRAASKVTGVGPKHIKIKNGRIYVRGSGEGQTFWEIASLYWERYGYDETTFLGKAAHNPPYRQSLRWIKKRGKDTVWGNWAAAHSFIAQVAEVEADVKTGQTRLLKITSVIDAGRVLNPMNARGNIEGGLYLGAGAALAESSMVDGQGRRINDTFLDYKFLTATDYPAITVDFVEPRKSYSTKGVGEVAVSPVAASIANAIYDATGARIRRIPITSEVLWKSLRDLAGSEGSAT